MRRYKHIYAFTIIGGGSRHGLKNGYIIQANCYTDAMLSLMLQMENVDPTLYFSVKKSRLTKHGYVNVFINVRHT